MSELFNPFSLQGKQILVTGASSGIGSGIATACAKMGATVILNGRNKERLQEVLQSLPRGDHKIFTADLRNRSALSLMVENIHELDGIVYCAGIGQRILCKQLSDKDIDDVMDINFKAQVLLQAELLR